MSLRFPPTCLCTHGDFGIQSQVLLFCAEHEFFCDGCREVDGDGLHGLCHGLSGSQCAAHQFEGISKLSAEQSLTGVSQHSDSQQRQSSGGSTGWYSQQDAAANKKREDGNEDTGGCHIAVEGGWFGGKSCLVQHIANFFVPGAMIFRGVHQLMQIRLAHLPQHRAFSAGALSSAEFILDATAQFLAIAKQDVGGQ
jgi:hypothetical protein